MYRSLNNSFGYNKQLTSNDNLQIPWLEIKNFSNLFDMDLKNFFYGTNDHVCANQPKNINKWKSNCLGLGFSSPSNLYQI